MKRSEQKNQSMFVRISSSFKRYSLLHVMCAFLIILNRGSFMIIISVLLVVSFGFVPCVGSIL